jgi:hypothetical protein
MKAVVVQAAAAITKKRSTPVVADAIDQIVATLAVSFYSLRKKNTGISN